MDVVVSNLAGSLDEVVALARAQAQVADVLELRLDACGGASEDELRRAFATLSKPVLVAVNGPEAFGTFEGTDAERIALLRRASAAGAAWVDVPWTLAASLGETRARRVVSRHVLDGTPVDLESLLAEVERVAGPMDRVKLVTHAACAEDGLRVLRLAADRARAGRPIVAFASGPLGSFTRVLAPVCGSLATYAAPSRGSGRAAAPGQIEADALRAMWPAAGATASTRMLGVAGRPVGASLSPRLHGAGLRAVSFDGVYVAFEPAGFDAFLALCAEVGVHGLSVTMPFKEDAARLATTRDDAVRACGAANTLVRTSVGWHATNTDASAVRTCVGRALCESDRKISDVTAVVVGTGGAARAALHALRDASRLVVAGRDATKRSALASAISAQSSSIDELELVPHDVLVNTTPLGSRAHPGAMPVPLAALRRDSIVLDAVYRPAETPLLTAARAAGASVLEGRAWFLEQALAQFTAFTGVPAPADTMRTELARALAEDELGPIDPRPIALVGLRASGKTTLGKLLAERIGRTFVDLDEEVSREDAALRATTVLRPAGEILETEGEPRFRDLEERALERVLSRTDSIVIATGGGVVERPRNRMLLRTRARCLWLQVPVAELQRRMRSDPTMRPALLGRDPVEEVAALAQRRDAWYRDVQAMAIPWTEAPAAILEVSLRALRV